MRMGVSVGLVHFFGQFSAAYEALICRINRLRQRAPRYGDGD
jgi:hypothetical protein